MEKVLIFTKDGSDNQAIIDGILKFVSTHYGQKKNCRMILPNGRLEYPCYKMLYAEDIRYLLIDAFDFKNESTNHILQFTAGEMHMICSESAIWMGQDSEVEFFEKEILIKRTGGLIRIVVD